MMPLPAANQVAPFQRAIAGDCTPPADEKDPPATISPVVVAASARTVQSHPDPIGNQEPCEKRAMRLAATPPAVVNDPAAIRSPFASGSSARTIPSIPVPNAVHWLVTGSQAAMRAATALPATVKSPPKIGRASRRERE